MQPDTRLEICKLVGAVGCQIDDALRARWPGSAAAAFFPKDWENLKFKAQALLSLASSRFVVGKRVTVQTVSSRPALRYSPLVTGGAHSIRVQTLRTHPDRRRTEAAFANGQSISSMIGLSSIAPMSLHTQAERVGPRLLPSPGRAFGVPATL